MTAFPFLQQVCENLPEEVRKLAGDRTASPGVYALAVHNTEG